MPKFTIEITDSKELSDIDDVYKTLKDLARESKKLLDVPGYDSKTINYILKMTFEEHLHDLVKEGNVTLIKMLTELFRGLKEEEINKTAKKTVKKRVSTKHRKR